MIARLLKLYPRGWRERYEDELGELLANQPLTPGLLADLLRGVLDAHLHPELVGPSFAGTARSLHVPVGPTVVLATSFVLLALLLGPLGLAPRLAAPTRGPGVALPGRVIEFVSYDDPTYGYLLVVPKDAQRERSSDGRRTTFTYRGDHLTFGTYAIQITVVPTEPGTTPDRLLLAQTEGARDASAPRPITANGIAGTARSYTVERSTSCPDRRAFTAAFVSGGEGYVIRIDSDAPGRCDAERVPETQALGSLRIRVSGS